MKLDLGCGFNKKEGYVGIDLVETADIQKHMLDYLNSLDDNSVDAVNACHSLEHLKNKQEFVAVFKEILRVCKNGAIIEIEVPYHTQSVNVANPYHHIYFNEHTFRFFCKQSLDKYNVIKPESLIRDYSFGLWSSANEGDLPGYVNIKKIEFIYIQEFQKKSDQEKEYARLHFNNVVLDMIVELEVEK